MKLPGILFSLVITTNCLAQLPLGWVYTITCSAVISENGQARTLQQGSIIFENNIITVKGPGTLTLLDSNNKFIYVNQPGNYRYKNLQKSLNVKPTGIGDKYFHYMWEDLFRAVSTKGPISSKIIGGVIAGAPRGDCMYHMIEPIDHSKVGDDTIYFSWGHIAGAKSYNFSLKDTEDNEFINIIVKDTSIAILKRNLLGEKATSYYWNVSTNEKEVNDCRAFFTVVSASEKQAVMDHLINGIEKDGGFLYYLKISELLAKEGWYKEAADYYLKARDSLINGKR